jgi:predicted GH43/DUF377 family glycosyl hydrolase
VIGSFNPGVVETEQGVLLLVRVAERPRERREGQIALPRWSVGEGPVVDWVAASDYEEVDPRVVRRRSDGVVRLTFLSHLRIAYSRDGRTIDHVGPPWLVPATEQEEFGVEDPRITRIGDRYFVTYVSVSRHGAATSLASTTDFEEIERHGVIFCPENKDVVLFPEKFGDAWLAIHRPLGGTTFTAPEMWTARSSDLVHWGDHLPLYGGGEEWESGRVGAGVPPLKLPEGWLEIYHGNRRPSSPGKVGEYFGAALLLGNDNPRRVERVGREPILLPAEDFEREGFVSDVVFPTGAIVRDDELWIYYGASDRHTGVTALSLTDVRSTLS